MSLHRCTDAECPLLGQRTSRHCRCHRTDEQVLREQRGELLNALEGLMAHEPDHSDTLWQHAHEAIAKARGQ